MTSSPRFYTSLFAVVQQPRDVTIHKKDGSFGFSLWFNEQGHYVEDVTLGSEADIAGLTSQDRLLKVNGENIESETHQNIVNRVRDCGDVIALTVVAMTSSKTQNEPPSVIEVIDII